MPKGYRFHFIIPTSQADSDLRAGIIRREFPGSDIQPQLFLDQTVRPTPPLATLNVDLHFATVYGRSPVVRRTIHEI